MTSYAKYTKIDDIFEKIISNIRQDVSVLKRHEFTIILDDIINRYKDKLQTESGEIIENWIKIKQNEFENRKINNPDYFVTSFIKQLEEKAEECVLYYCKYNEINDLIND